MTFQTYMAFLRNKKKKLNKSSFHIMKAKGVQNNQRICCVQIRLLILRPKSMYSFCEEKVHTFECVAKE